MLAIVLWLFSVFFVLDVSSKKDYYQLLEVPRTATERDIKKSFRSLSKKNHPDKFAKKPLLRKAKEKKFMELSEAYEVLSDKKKRQEYDAGGPNGGGGRRGPGGPFGGGPPGHRQPQPAADPFANVRFITSFTSDTALRQTIDRLSIVVVYYEGAHEDIENFKEGVQDFAKKFNDAGIVNVGAVNCKKHRTICEGNNVRTFPAAMYYAPRLKTVFQHTYSGNYAAKSLESWTSNVLSNECREMRTMFRVRRWMAANQSIAKVLLLTDKDKPPPIIKALAIEYSGRLSLGVVLKGAEEEIATALGVSKMPALLHIVDESSLRSESFKEEFQKASMARFLTSAVKKHQDSKAPLPELDSLRLNKGECAPADNRFCLLFFVPGTARVAQGLQDTIKKLTVKFKSDPIRILTVRDEGFASAFEAAAAASGSVVLYRPKRKRYRVFPGDVEDTDGLAEFVEGTLASGMQLPELLSLTPDVRMEL